MAQDHYRILGVSRNATATEIKSAYRKLVLVHHPDKSASPQSGEMFHNITEAYNVLSDIDRRRTYDRSIDNQARTHTQAQQQPRPQPQQPKVSPATAVATDVTKLTLIFTRGQYTEAERLARAILQRDQRQPIPYAVLGDLARARGQLAEAAKMYAFAAQMDPRNPVYQQRHEELLKATQQAMNPVEVAKSTQRNTMTGVVGSLLILSSCLYIALAKEPAIAPAISIVSSWTLGLCVMLFLAGVSTGSALSSTNLIDRFNVSAVASTGRIASPIVALTTIAIVNFWAAALLFLGLSASQKGYALSHLRFIGGIAGVTLLMVFASAISASAFSPAQVFLWGGNITYLGGICGWMVSDSFKRI